MRPSAAIEDRQDGCESLDGRTVDRVEDDLDLGDPDLGVGAQAGGDRLGRRPPALDTALMIADERARCPAGCSKEAEKLQSVGAVLVALLAATSATLVTDRPTGASGTESVSIEASVAFRIEFGLRADDETLAAVSRDKAADMTWGVPLTSAEAANMATRQQLQAEADALVEYVMERPDVFGGF